MISHVWRAADVPTAVGLVLCLAAWGPCAARRVCAPVHHAAHLVRRGARRRYQSLALALGRPGRQSGATGAKARRRWAAGRTARSQQLRAG